MTMPNMGTTMPKVEAAECCTELGADDGSTEWPWTAVLFGSVVFVVASLAVLVSVFFLVTAP